MKNNRRGTTFIELLLYMAIFLVLTPILLTVAINSIRQNQEHTMEKDVNADSQFVVERIYDTIGNAKKVDVENSRLSDPNGKLMLTMQDDSALTIELNSTTHKVEITEGGVTAALSSGNAQAKSLFFEKIADTLNDPDVLLGINVRLQMTGADPTSPAQNYVFSANLERGDFDEDGSPDFLDKFVRYPECAGDADEDGICDEMDNCVLVYNPFQEDYDEDDIGDECDSSIFFPGGGGGGGGLGAFNCNPFDQLIALINQEPPLASLDLKQILMSSSPLPPEVLNELIDTHPLITNTHFAQVFIANVKLPEGVRENVQSASNIPALTKAVILIADTLADWIPWLGHSETNNSLYQVTLFSDATPPENWNNHILFHDADHPLGENGEERTDIFIIDVQNGTDTVTVKTTADAITVSTVVTEEDNYHTDDNGFIIELNDIVGSSYAFMVSSIYNTAPLSSLEFDFGSGANVVNPTGTYTSDRYVCYCEGGCADNCGDGGTGIITDNVYTDRCYRWDYFFPEWCSRWYTFDDDNSVNPAYVGGTHEGEETVYWEKSFKTVLTDLQLEKLQSITVGGEIAYQSITQFFCDTLSSSCPMSGNLIGNQDVEMFNWDTGVWDLVGLPALDGETSDQQKFEVKYDNPADVLKYVGGDGGRVIKARMKFHWEGIPPEGSGSAPCFMAIDYFTLHLKW
ncbi:hypothetical protein JXA05_04015 [Candidatus Peregrinibacteria bacterium]|nr:hypothetical protein [Candidatus Peregrinibacteria bacterium]